MPPGRISLICTRGGVPEIGAAWTKALELAESLDDAEYQLRSLWGLWFFHVNRGRSSHRSDTGAKVRFLAATRPDPNDRLVGERMIGVSQHYLGDQHSARRHLERVLARLRCSRPSVAIHSLSDRPAGDGARLSCMDPVAAGVSGSGDAHSRKQHRGCTGNQSRHLAMLRSGPGGMPDRAVDRRSGRSGALHGHAARSFDAACAGALASLRPRLSRGARDQARRCVAGLRAAARRPRRARRSQVRPADH